MPADVLLDLDTSALVKLVVREDETDALCPALAGTALVTMAAAAREHGLTVMSPGR